ncbi:hypothetical protein [Reichenbachiella versicolor]|uniref:hypothetical protein n=1 Tax=Reichenbachiella versicolor TaxID=1821036 RepID=UPI000D6E200B|nr:hypothetical protein [Reichenbachiella versicolor]
MSLQTAKWDLMQKIMNVTKESLIEKIDQILDQEMIVGYTVSGKPLTKQMYNDRLEEAEKQLSSGSYTTQEDLERESENW